MQALRPRSVAGLPACLVRPVAEDYPPGDRTFYAHGASCSTGYGRVHLVGIAGPSEKPHVRRGARRCPSSWLCNDLAGQRAGPRSGFSFARDAGDADDPRVHSTRRWASSVLPRSRRLTAARQGPKESIQLRFSELLVWADFAPARRGPVTALVLAPHPSLSKRPVKSTVGRDLRRVSRVSRDRASAPATTRSADNRYWWTGITRRRVSGLSLGDQGIATVGARRTIGFAQGEAPQIEAATAKTSTAPEQTKFRSHEPRAVSRAQLRRSRLPLPDRWGEASLLGFRANRVSRRWRTRYTSGRDSRCRPRC